VGVIIATERGSGRAIRRLAGGADRTRQRIHSPKATEHLTPAEIVCSESEEQTDGPRLAGERGCRINPGVAIEGDSARKAGIYDTMNGSGAHEIVIETTNAGLQIGSSRAEGRGAVVGDVQRLA